MKQTSILFLVAIFSFSMVSAQAEDLHGEDGNYESYDIERTADVEEFSGGDVGGTSVTDSQILDYFENYEYERRAQENAAAKKAPLVETKISIQFDGDGAKSEKKLQTITEGEKTAQGAIQPNSVTTNGATVPASGGANNVIFNNNVYPGFGGNAVAGLGWGLPEKPAAAPAPQRKMGTQYTKVVVMESSARMPTTQAAIGMPAPAMKKSEGGRLTNWLRRVLGGAQVTDSREASRPAEDIVQQPERFPDAEVIEASAATEVPGSFPWMGTLGWVLAAFLGTIWFLSYRARIGRRPVPFAAKASRSGRKDDTFSGTFLYRRK